MVSSPLVRCTCFWKIKVQISSIANWGVEIAKRGASAVGPFPFINLVFMPDFSIQSDGTKYLEAWDKCFIAPLLYFAVADGSPRFLFPLIAMHTWSTGASRCRD